MSLLNLQLFVLTVCLCFMIAQIWVSPKRTSHILFAIFCGSVAMSIAKTTSGTAIGEYQYLVGMTACVTCNGYWLLSRTFFRQENSITGRHITFAAAIAFLIIVNQGYLFFENSELLNIDKVNVLHYLLRELTILLSSSTLVLSFWEGCRGFTQAPKVEKAQRLLFLTTFGGAVAASKACDVLLQDSAHGSEFATTLIILFVIVNTQLLLFWRTKTQHARIHSNLYQHNDIQYDVNEDRRTGNAKIVNVDSVEATLSSYETEFAEKVKNAIETESLYLQPNLKIADIAQKLGTSEYRISNALRHHLQAKNFNQYVNALRITHAQQLLEDDEKQHWTVLVIGLESGFASVGPFTRAFKSATGTTPNQYRQQKVRKLASC